MSEVLTPAAAPRKGAGYNRGNSNQSVGTPPELVEACARRFGVFAYDLAASAENAKAPCYITKAQNTFSYAWYLLGEGRGNLWLNPEFADIDPYAEKCKHEAERGARIIMLTPNSTGSLWFLNHVFGRALVSFIRPRFKFVGAEWVYPKDLMLSIFGLAEPGFECWDWKTGEITPLSLKGGDGQ